MELGRVGIWSLEFLLHRDAGEVQEAAAELEELGFEALFIPGWMGGPKVFPGFRRLLAGTESVPVVSGIVNVWMHTPEETAAEYTRLERDYPGRFQLGLGISHSDALEPGQYQRPVATMGDYLDGLDGPAECPPPERRLLAALGPRMLDLAGARTAGTHPYFVPVEHTRFARERLGPAPVIAVEQTVVLGTDATRVREQAREFIADYLVLPNYTNNLRRHGFDEADLRDGGSDRLVDAIVAWGDEGAIAQRIAEHHEAGADHVCVQVIGGDDGLPREQWRGLASLLPL